VKVSDSQHSATPSAELAVAGSLAECFRHIALHHPDRIAIHDDDAVLRYRDVAGMAGGIAGALAGAALRPGDRVGLLLDHGAAMAAAALGTLAAGGCYVPLDPGYPAERLVFMASHAGIRVLLTGAAHARLARELDAGLATLRADDIGPGDLEITETDPDQPAYVLYTSGSTGRPKGVAQTHRNVLHGVRNHLANFGIGPSDRLSLLSSFCFDMAVTDMYAAVLSGATLVTIDVRRHGMNQLARALADRGVTVYHSTPTVYEHLIAALGDRRLPGIRAVLLGGEQVRRAHVLAARSHFGADCVLVNGYGATEVTFAAQYRISPGDDIDREVVPIGYPLAGYDVVLLDDRGRAGQRTGEIAVRSRYLAPGYWNDATRTAERFGAASDGTPIYRTGDHGALLADGRLVCLGRSDRQVKIRGHRVELGEIEAHLARLPGVAHAVAAVRGQDLAEIIGYVVPGPGSQLDPGALRRSLARRLPDYVMPAAIVIMSEFPLTATGKVDIEALPAAPEAAGPGGPPVTAGERLIAAAWCDVLGVPAVGLDASFFDLGGNSLLLAALQRRLGSALGREVPLIAILEHASVRGLARCLDGGQAGEPELDRVTGRMARRRAARDGQERR
jgi:amino acid adenylation domain-containing protein